MERTSFAEKGGGGDKSQNPIHSEGPRCGVRMVAAMTVQASGWSKGLQAKRTTAMVGNVGCGARRARSATGCQVRPLRWRREDRLEQAGGRRTATCEAQQGEAPGALTPELR